MISLQNIPRDTLKSILAEILQDHGPRSRVESFARQSGYRTDAAMTAADNLETSPGDLARAAAQGRVLPHLVLSAFPLVAQSSNRRGTARAFAPRADAILRASSAGLDRDAFKEGLGDLIGAAREAPAGLPRWFFAVAAADVLLEPPAGADRFWLSKAAAMLCGILAMAAHIPQGTGFHEGLAADLAGLPEASLSPWELHGRRLLAHPMPSKTQESIYETMLDALPASTWSRQEAASGLSARPGIMPTESWQAF